MRLFSFGLSKSPDAGMRTCGEQGLWRRQEQDASVLTVHKPPVYGEAYASQTMKE